MAANDDLLTPEEIEALMQAARSTPSPGAAPSAGPPSAASGTAVETFDNPGQDSPALKSSFPRTAGIAPAPTAATGDAWSSGPDQLLSEAESQLAAALAPDMGRIKGPPPELGPPQNFAFPDFARETSDGAIPAFSMNALQDVELELRIELGRTELLIEEVLQLREGTVVPLDKLAGDPVDILVNGRMIARGEVLVLNDNFCVRVAEILAPEV